MAIVREGGRTALLVVDVQVGVIQEAWDKERIVANIALVVERARERGVPVLWVQQTDDDFVEGSESWRIVPALVPRPGEPVVLKYHQSSFEETPLEAELARLGATHLVLAGAATNWCIRATAYAALDRGYDLTLVGDAHTTESGTLEDGTRLEAANLVADLNLAMKYLSYPGRANAAVAARAIDFEPPRARH